MIIIEILYGLVNIICMKNADSANLFEKAEIFPTTIKSAAITAGSLYLFNKSLDSELLRPLLTGYRKTIHKLVGMVAGDKLCDTHLKDNAATSLLDFFVVMGTVLILGRTPISGSLSQISENIQNLFSNSGKAM